MNMFIRVVLRKGGRGMLQLTCWLAPLQGHILHQSSADASLSQRASVRFARYWDGPDPTALWVGSGQELRTLLEQYVGLSALRGHAFFSTGTAQGLEELAQAMGVFLVVTDLELLELHERLSAVLRQYRSWELRLMEAAGRRHSIQDVADCGAELAGGALFLLSTGGRVVYYGGHTCLDSDPAREMLDHGILSPATAAILLPKSEGGPSLVCQAMGSRGKCWTSAVYKGGSLISHMLLFTPTGWRDSDTGPLLDLVSQNVSRVAACREGRYWAGADFKTLLADLLTGRLTDEEEIRRRFSLISRIPQQFCSFIIVEPSRPGSFADPPSALLAQLETIFPESNAAVYDGGIVLLLSRPDRDFQPAPIFDQRQLQELLVHYDAFAAISNATSRRSMLRTNYLLTKSVLQLGRALRPCANQRIFFFEDYAEYVSIDLCINSFNALLGHDDIIYLTHPDAVKLYRYDLLHKTNLIDVLYYYCLNNGSVSQAARAAYMHRNTFSARLAKLQELIKADLTSGELQQRMVFSCKILRYYDRYAKINLGKRLCVSLPQEGTE